MGRCRTFVLALIVFFTIDSTVTCAQPPLVAVFDYIDTYSGLAVEQMASFRIPASVILAQAIFESGSGTSILAKKSNNHFGIKCHVSWEGDTIVKTDDEENECFRKYASIRESYIDHSNFLASRKRYAHLFKLPVSDYRSWCQGIKSAGYATYPDYASELIKIIERYQLYLLDRPQVMHPVTFMPKTPQIKKSAFDPATASLQHYAQHGLLSLNEADIHIRSLDIIIEEDLQEDIPVAGK